VAAGIPIYFCDPHNPWQRGPMRTPTDCSASACPKERTCTCTVEDLARIGRSLNDRPRKTLGCMKPSERLAELLALTA
jgi:IS30 family transposase